MITPSHAKYFAYELTKRCASDSKDYPTIADITKERVRRVIKKLNEEDSAKLDLEGAKPQDRGFRVFKLAESNFKPWNADVPHDAPALEKQLDLHVDHIREDRTADDLLYEILLKSGFPLSTPVEALKLASKSVYSVAGGALFICLEGDLTLELIRAMAEKKPERVVCLDEGFAGNDQLKANAVQIFKTKGVTSFKTV
jgi:adenine-specific DNA-methyltransferase